MAPPGPSVISEVRLGRPGDLPAQCAAWPPSRRVRADNDAAVRFVRAVAPGTEVRFDGGAEYRLTIPVGAPRAATPSADRAAARPPARQPAGGYSSKSSASCTDLM